MGKKMETERWLPIEGWAGYEISSFGNVRSYKNKHGNIGEKYHHLLCKSKRREYYCVELNNGSNKVRKYSIHRLVAVAFIPNNYNKPQVNHIDADKGNNHFSNLEWVTPLENTRHAHANGLKKDFGEMPIIQFTRNGDYVNKYKSLTNAGDVTGIKISNISKVTSGLRNHAGGFKWKYA